MRARFPIFAFVAAMAFGGAVRGETAPLENTDAFEKAYAASFYTFDACGDSKNGRIFRQVLVERVKQCPFNPRARDVFRARAAKIREKSGAMIFDMIEKNGGLMMKLEGMTMTCREQQHQADYVALSEKLDKFASAQAPATDVIRSACDADEIAP